MSSVFTEEQRIKSRLAAMTTVYQTVDRALGNEDDIRVVLQWEPNMKAAAWTDGQKITINASQVDAIDFHNVDRFHGLNFHELSHVLFTPRSGSLLANWVRENRFHTAFNALEDQRIESLMTGRYPSVAPWLTTAILRWVIENEVSPTGYILVRGRKFLPGSLRGRLRATFCRQDLLPEVDAVIDQYRRLIFPTDIDAAKDCIARFNDILREVFPDGGGGGGGGGTTTDDGGTITDGGWGIPLPDPHGHGGREEETVKKGRPVSSNSQRDIDVDASEKDEEETVPVSVGDNDNDNDDAESDGEGSSSGDESDDDASQDSAEDDVQIDSSPRPEGQSDDWSDDSDDDSDDSDGKPGDGADTDGGESASDSRDGSNNGDLTSLAEELLEKVFDDADVQRDIRRTLAQLKELVPDSLEQANWRENDVLPQYTRPAKVLRNRIQKLLMAADPGWNRREARGKLSVSRWVRDRDIRTAFDRWDEGVNDAANLEVVILIDESGSMGSSGYENAANAAWAVKRSMDSIGARTTVINFGSDCRTIYSAKDKAAQSKVRFYYGNGGTQPKSALEQASSIMARSRCKQRIFIAFTDGDWFDDDDRYDTDTSVLDQYIVRMRNAGVITALGFISTKEGRVDYKSHACAIHKAITHDDLLPFMSEIVTASIKSRLARR
jgi:Mg-chelatase subunit ChlD